MGATGRGIQRWLRQIAEMDRDEKAKVADTRRANNRRILLFTRPIEARRLTVA